MAQNSQGLSRHIPSAIKRQLRQEAGFGCVVCGLAIGTYEHIIDFVEVSDHDPGRMAFLCHQCHGKVTRGQMSKETVISAKKNPYAIRHGYSREAFDTNNLQPEIHFGPAIVKKCQIHIEIEGIPTFWVESPDTDGGPMLLNADIRNNKGEKIFQIIKNEWHVNSSNWDVEVVGPEIIIRNAHRDIALQIRAIPPSRLDIIRMDMMMLGHRLICDKNEFYIQTKDNMQHTLKEVEIQCSGAAIGLLAGGVFL